MSNTFNEIALETLEEFLSLSDEEIFAENSDDTSYYFHQLLEIENVLFSSNWEFVSTQQLVHNEISLAWISTSFVPLGKTYTHASAANDNYDYTLDDQWLIAA